MAGNNVCIIKASGEEQPFSEWKLRNSLRRSGADEATIDNVVSTIKRELRDGMTTRQIYSRAFSLIRKNKVVAIQYSLRQAIMELGPTGFPFEKFIGEVLKTRGFSVRVGVLLRGFCVTHEVDVLASRDDKHIFVEAKFHNRHGVKSDLKDALYVKARFDDLRAIHRRHEKNIRTPIIHEGWLITNTKLTTKAKRYGRCAGLTVIGWNYPAKGNLQDLIIESKVHPITCLTTLSTARKRAVFENGIVLCRDLLRRRDLLRALGMSERGIDKVFEEIGLLCGGGVLKSVRGVGVHRGR